MHSTSKVHCVSCALQCFYYRKFFEKREKNFIYAEHFYNKNKNKIFICMIQWLNYASASKIPSQISRQLFPLKTQSKSNAMTILKIRMLLICFDGLFNLKWNWPIFIFKFNYAKRSVVRSISRAGKKMLSPFQSRNKYTNTNTNTNSNHHLSYPNTFTPTIKPMP